MNEEKQEEDVYVQRQPIIISNDTIALITLFTNHSYLQDCWTYDYLHNIDHDQATFAAMQFVDQLEDQWTPAFMMALRKQITLKLEEHDKEFGTEFSKRDE